MDDKWQIEWWDGSQADKIKDKIELYHFEEKDGGTGSQGNLCHENVITDRTRTGHKVSGTHRTNGKCRAGGVNEKMRGARGARRKEVPSMRDVLPKEEGK
jgi:hypothetical protein